MMLNEGSRTYLQAPVLSDAVRASTFSPGAPAVASPRLIRVMQVVDSLETGGKEQVAVNVGNMLPRQRYRSYLCTTRAEGPLAGAAAPDVTRLRIERRGRFDGRGLWRLVRFLNRERIDILHAHGSSVFIASAAAAFPPYPAVVWHDHYGPYVYDSRPTWLYRQALRRVQGVIAVNRPLAEWSRRALAMDADRVWYVPNFVCIPRPRVAALDLPGTPGFRIICTANLRPQKDHLTLLRAVPEVLREHPAAHVLIVGMIIDQDHHDVIQQEVSRLNLASHVSFLGQRADVSDLLRQSDIGVLSSASEGFPLALIEYGLAGLASVSTAVGECPDVLDQGRAGLLVPPGDPAALAEALNALLRSRERRAELGQRFRDRVLDKFTPESVVSQICHVYETVLDGRGRSAPNREGYDVHAEP
jgi:glycosyltransferase involved in cell wall biosynthesis